MKYLIILMIAAFPMFAAGKNYSQTESGISVKTGKIQLTDLFKEIEDQSRYVFFYVDSDVKNVTVAIDAQKGQIRNILDKALMNTDLSYEINDFNVNISHNVKKTETPSGQIRKHTISGYIKDVETGEVLIGATVYISDLQTGLVTNAYGFYSVELPEGTHSLQYSYIGYKVENKTFNISSNTQENISLKPATQELQEVVVTSSPKAVDIQKPQMGVEKLSSSTVKKVPVVFGETDIIKVLQMMPGVQPASEGTTGFSVRGGGIDQNLILLDDAPVYNAGHMMGFFSVFNNDAVKNVELYKGDIPACYGGRLSSLLDVRMRDGNSKHFSATGSLGLISSRLMIEGPIGTEKLTYMLSARRTYLDLFFPLMGDDVKGSKMYFYDLNGKLSWTINDKNRLYFSAFSGKDVLGMDDEDELMSLKFAFNNSTQTLRWNHVFSPKLFANVTLINSDYNYDMDYKNGETFSYKWQSELMSQGLKGDFSWYPNLKNTIDFGVQGLYYTIDPATVNPTSDESIIQKYTVNKTKALETTAYISNTQKLTDWLKLRYGLRFSEFQTMGKTTQYYYNENHTFDYEKDFGSREKIKSYQGLEPRAALSFILSPNTSIKASYSRNCQYIQQAIYSAAGSPFDIWFTASPTVKPQISDQFSAGFFKNFSNNAIETSVELFYKNNKNTIDFKDHPDVIMNEKMEGELRFGKSYAYGAEFMVKLNFNRLNGWISYTYSDAKYKIPEINDGKAYRSPLNHKHSVNVVMSYDLSKRVSLSGNWVYYTGMPTTFPVAHYEVGGEMVPLYSSRNEDKYPDYHRMDLSLTLKGKKHKRWQGEWVFSLYNLYGRKNTWSVYFDYDDEKQKMTANHYYLYRFVPSVSYNFTF